MSAHQRHCPSCHGVMSPSEFVNHVDMPFTIDICWPCHLIWFDHLESTALSPASVIDLFRRIHTHRDDNRNIVSLQGACPVCESKLLQTNDIGRGGRFTYHRCPQQHGRLISFAQFLREKNFVRTLKDQERKALSATVRQIRCSSCGAGVDIAHDAACKHCGAPVSVLDEQAVAKALTEFDARANRQRDAAQQNVPQPTGYVPSPAPWQPPESNGLAVADLIVTELAAILAATLN